ncbi:MULTISPECIES: 3'-5' exonuclease [Lachnospiraceae]|uniref:3'-5' exonuclease n=1 Tax=Lachnospiraceae TaxID=186803 RepID=UPI001FA95755|nr:MULTISPECIES: 3'-5' exonuclease [Lachnospiraceae]
MEEEKLERSIRKSEIPGLTREEEEAQLAKVIGIAEQNLEQAKADIRSANEDLADLMETYDAKEAEGLALWNNATAKLNAYQHGMARLEKARKKPYFGRIDFQDPRLSFLESYYIGRVGISDEKAEPVVLDWRAPISSVYYENSTGPCSYTVSSEGTFSIDLKRKRTYEIENDHLKDFFDSDVVANDELLTKYLAKNKKAVLGEIIATIQQEQNLIIRRSPKTNLIVQGVAGSGKTTVAMHRISYILYNYEEDFRPEDFYIIGSNRILLNYITSVLPELDVYGIRQMTMEQLFIRLLYEDWDEEKYMVHTIDRADEKNSIKGGSGWFFDLENFCRTYEAEQIPREPLRLEKTGTLLLDAEYIDNYCREQSTLSMEGKMCMLNEILLAKFENEVSGKEVTFPAREKKALKRKYEKYFGDGKWKGSIFDLYSQFLEQQAEKGKAVEMPENSFDVYDLAALAYLYKRIKENDPVREASHVVIDEAQDFGMMAYQVLHYCLRDCTYTIMGDTSQNIHFSYGLNDWEELKKLILTGTYDAFGVLRKSYRNTVEISDFANEILRHGDFAIYPVEPVLRHGTTVQKEAFADEAALLAAGVQKIKAWQEQGYETIAVVCRDEAEAAATARKLKKYVPVVEENLETAEFGEGVMVLPVAYTKGLEFDAVLLLDPTEEKYPENDGQVKLLYVAATRALHELAVLYTGKLTGILAKKAPKGRHNQEFAMETLTKAKEYEKVSLTQKETREENRAIGIQEMDERNSHGPKRIVIKPEQIPGRAPGNTSTTGTAVMPKSSTGMRKAAAETGKEIAAKTMQQRAPEGVSAVFAGAAYRGKTGGKAPGSRPATAGIQSEKAEQPEHMNTSPYAFGAIPENELLRMKGHSRIKCAVKWAKKGKAAVEMASMYGILRITPITPEVIRISFVKGVTAKVQDTYWKPKADTLFPWSAKESKTAVLVETEKLRVMVEKKDGAVQFFTPDHKLVLSEKRDEPRMIDGGMTWTFFDWSGSEKLKAKGILSTEWLDLTAKARYVSFGGKQARMPLVVSNRGYGIAAAASRTALLCNVRTFGTYLHTAGDGQIDYYFILGKDRDEIIKQYKEL